MFTQIAGIVLLAVMFIIATALPINMGALALVAAFIIGLLSHLAAKDIFAGFPADLFVTLVGITYLFAIAQNNGTVDWLVQKAVWLVRGRVAVMPWVMFFVAAMLTAVGAVSPAAVAIIAPIAAFRGQVRYKSASDGPDGYPWRPGRRLLTNKHLWQYH
jgi:di/tricarboxylate transporter